MPKKETVSIVIITRNRSVSIDKCLFSLCQQITTSDEILIIDNNSSDNTNGIIQQYQKNFWRLKYYFEPQIGISHCRNRGIAEAKNSWLAFIDDDCIAKSNWIAQLHQAISKYPHVAAIVGPNIPYDKSNVYSIASTFYYNYWLVQSLKKFTVINYEVLDTKNLILNLSFLRTHAISFDTSLPLGEDCDLGIQIERCKGRAYFNPSMQVIHKHPTKQCTFLLNQLAYSLSAIMIMEKWKPRKTRIIDKPLFEYFIQFITQNRFSIRKRVYLFIVIFAIAIINKLLFLTCKHTVFRTLILFFSKPVISLYATRPAHISAEKQFDRT